MDFITRLPTSNGFNIVLVIVDHLSKMAYYIPTMTEYHSETLAKLFMDYVFYLHDLQDSIITD